MMLSQSTLASTMAIAQHSMGRTATSSIATVDMVTRTAARDSCWT